MRTGPNRTRAAALSYVRPTKSASRATALVRDTELGEVVAEAQHHVPARFGPRVLHVSRQRGLAVLAALTHEQQQRRADGMMMWWDTYGAVSITVPPAHLARWLSPPSRAFVPPTEMLVPNETGAFAALLRGLLLSQAVGKLRARLYI